MVAVAGAGQAAEHVVRLVTDGPGGRFRFEPQLLFAAVGDEVRLVPASRLHSVKSIAGMLPAGVAPLRGRMGAEVLLRLEAPGVYGLKCAAHYQIGMVALIVAGEVPANWEAARAVRHPSLPASTLQRLFSTAACRLRAGGAGGCDQEAAPYPVLRPGPLLP
jgi:pseudoazurin